MTLATLHDPISSQHAPDGEKDLGAHDFQAPSPPLNNHGDVEKKQAPNDNNEPHQPQSLHKSMSSFRWAIICISLYVTCTLYGLDTTIAADVQGPIIQAFGKVDQLTWIGAGFPLGSVCVILLLGTLYNSFNIKWTYIITVILFEAGSALCGAAPNMNALIVGRVITGAGGSGIYLGSLVYFTVMTTEKERGFYMSLVAACWGLGAVLGPVIGGAFAVSSATWRWAFYINLVIGAASIPAFLFALPSISPIKGVSVGERIKRIDFVGFILGAGVWVSFLMALTMAGGQWPWKDGRTIATFVVFGVVLALYAVQQRFAIFTTKEWRTFPVHLLSSRTQVLLYVVTAAGTTTLFVMVYYVPLYFTFVNDDSAIMAAVRLLPFIIIAVVSNLLSGSFLRFMRYYLIIYIVAGVCLVAGGGPMMVFLNSSTSTGVIYGLTVIVAVGAGLSMVTGYAISTMTLPPEEAGAGLKMQNLAQIGGQVIALAISGQVYQSTASQKLTAALAGQGYSAADIQSGASGVTSSLFQQLGGDLRDTAVVAIAEAMELTFVLVPVAGAVMLIAAVLMKHEKLTGTVVAAGG